jgi:hypothetical protein
VARGEAAAAADTIGEYWGFAIGVAEERCCCCCDDDDGRMRCWWSQCSSLASCSYGRGAVLVAPSSVDKLEGAVCVSGISPADLARVITLAEQGDLSTAATTALGGIQEQLVQRVADRLCARESNLALEAKATKARCVSC